MSHSHHLNRFTVRRGILARHLIRSWQVRLFLVPGFLRPRLLISLLLFFVTMLFLMVFWGLGVEATIPPPLPIPDILLLLPLDLLIEPLISFHVLLELLHVGELVAVVPHLIKRIVCIVGFFLKLPEVELAGGELASAHLVVGLVVALLIRIIK